MKTTKSIGERISAARRALHMSQRKLGEALDGTPSGKVSATMVGRYEGGGELSAQRLLDIAQVLGKPAAWFIEGDKETYTAKTVGDLIRLCNAIAAVTGCAYKIRRPENELVFIGLPDSMCSFVEQYRAIADEACAGLRPETGELLKQAILDSFSEIELSQEAK